MHLPDYRGSSIVNLMASLMLARGADARLYAPLPLLEPGVLSKARNLVLIVIDGLGYEYLSNTAKGGVLHRHLKGRMTSVFPSTTASAIPVFLTGMAPQQHGITGWFTYFKELDSVVTVLPFTKRHGGESLSTMGVDAARLFDHRPVFELIDTASYVVVPKHIAHSVFNLTHCRGAELRPYSSMSQFFSVLTRTLKQSSQSKYIYAYWPKLDHIAHDKGIHSRAVSAHFAELDAAFGRFLIDIENSESTVIVTADHGMIDSGPQRLIELNNHPDMLKTLAHPLCGERRMAYCYVLPDKRQEFEAYVKSELSDYITLFKREELISGEFFGLGRSHPRLHQRIGNYALVMKQNFMIKDWLAGERHYMHIGTHGGVSQEEMYVPLIVAEL
jgi:predicted AlkP superfamily pyrophosphatase or phosphodiesterase